jgi:hypothetical protein
VVIVLQNMTGMCVRKKIRYIRSCLRFQIGRAIVVGLTKIIPWDDRISEYNLTLAERKERCSFAR